MYEIPSFEQDAAEPATMAPTAKPVKMAKTAVRAETAGAEQAKAVRASVARPVFGAVRARDERPAGMMENPVGVAVEAVTEATLVLAMMVKRAVTARQALPEKPETKDSPPPLEMGNGRRAERVLVGLEGAVSVAAAAEAAAVVQ